MCCPDVQQPNRPPNERDIAARTDSNTPPEGPVISHKRGASVPLSDHRCPASGVSHRRGKSFRYLTWLELAQLWLAQLIDAHDMLAQLIEAQDMLAHDMLAQLIELHDADAHDMLAQDIAFHTGSFDAVLSHASESNWLSPLTGSTVTNWFRPRFGFAVPSAVLAAACACTSPTPSAPPAV
jgi:hypothetical protein